VFSFGTVLETGIAVSAYEQNDIVDIFEQRNEVNEVIEVVSSNARAEITITGELSATATKILGTVMTPANLITAQFGTLTTGIMIVKGVNHSASRSKNVEIKITGTFYPLLVA
jgi:hypothetical protein